MGHGLTYHPESDIGHDNCSICTRAKQEAAEAEQARRAGCYPGLVAALELVQWGHQAGVDSRCVSCGHTAAWGHKDCIVGVALGEARKGAPK